MKKNEKESAKISKKFIGITEIEALTGKKYMDLDDLRVLFGFPMKCEGVDWTLSASDFGAWLAKFKIGDMRKVTLDSLKQHLLRYEVEAEIDSEKVIIGAKNIENFMHLSYIALVSWRASYEFPLTYENGQPALKMVDLKAWVQKHGGNLAAITTGSLRRDYELEQIQNTEGRELTGLQEIAEFTGRPEHIVLKWFKDFDSFPGERKGDNFKVDSRDLLLWMHKENESCHPGGGYR